MCFENLLSAGPGGGGSMPKGKKIDADAESDLVKQHKQLNHDYLEELNAAVTLVRGHEQCDDLINLPPLELGKGGTLAPFTMSQYDKVLKDKLAQSFDCGGNMFWVDPFFAVLYGIPYSMKRVLSVANHRFATPSPFPFPIAIPIKAHVKDWKPMDHKGALQHQTPEEMIHAWYFALARDIKEQKEHSVIQEWKRFALSMPLSFLKKTHRQGLSESDSMYFEQYDFR